MTRTSLTSFLPVLPLCAGLAAAPTVQAQAAPAASAPASGNAMTNKAAKPPVDAAASKAGVATKKPAKTGAQAGAAASEPKK
jgi:hypothetical protein